MTVLRAGLLALLPMLAGCGESRSGEPASTPSGSPTPSAFTNGQVPAKALQANTRPRFHLSGPADAESLAAAMDVADHAMSEAAATPAQSFRIMDGDRHVASLVSGQGRPIDAAGMACFTALVQDGKTALVSTVGTGEWEAETCSATTSLAILSAEEAVTIGVIADAASPNAQSREPIVLTWEPATGSLAIDEKRTRQASLAGAGTIAAIRKAIAAP